MTRIWTVAKKKVCYRNQRFWLWYRMRCREDGYCMEVICRSGSGTEQACVRLPSHRDQALEIVKLFAEEHVFPIALKEPLREYLQ